MSPMVSIRRAPTAAHNASRWTAARGSRLSRPPIRALYTVRGIATNAAVQEPDAEFPGSSTGLPPAPRQSLQQRKKAIETAKPFSAFLTDSFNRQHDYLRISITERCNLRCLYCMPEEGVPLSPPAHLLTTPEIVYLSSLFVSQGVTKIRLTGGEPTVRRDVVPLMQSIGALRSKGLRELALTTNGISLYRKLDTMVEAGLTGVNLSLDTLDPFQFQIMTRRKGFDAVMKCIDRILEMKKLGANLKLKVNCVVMRGLNERDIVPFVELGREKDIEVRFIEYMPFGGNKWSEGKMIGFQEMLGMIKVKYPGLRSVPGHKNDTSKTFEVPGFIGKVGFITSMTSDFCGTCNRLRITGDGNLKVCLHGNDEVSLRDLLRKGNSGQPIDQAAFERIRKIELDHRGGSLSGQTTLGWGERERELLEIIGVAVKRKAEKHADMADLKNMTNRPMILIDQSTHPAPIQMTHHHLTTNPSASLLRSNSVKTSPRLPFLYPLLATNSTSNIRAFSSSSTYHAIGNKSLVNRVKNSELRAQILEEVRKRNDQAMLDSLNGGQTLDQKRHWEHERLKRDAQRYESKKARFARLKLERVHLRGAVNPADKRQSRIFEHLRDTPQGMAVGALMGDMSTPEPTRPAPPSIKELKKRIIALESQVTMEKLYPPTLDPGDWNTFNAVPEGLGMTRDTKRVVWRQRRKAVQQLERTELKSGDVQAEKESIEQDYRDDVDDMEITLAHLKFSLENYNHYGQDELWSLKGQELRNERNDLRAARMAQVEKWKAWQIKDAWTRPRPELAFGALKEMNQITVQFNDQRPQITGLQTFKIPQSKTTTTSAPQDMENRSTPPNVFGKSNEPEPIPSGWPKPRYPSSQRTLTDNLKSVLPMEGSVTIDDELTIEFDSHEADLQSQVFQLQNRLKNAYPRIETLPYEVWKSKNRNVLKTWLKILSGKWITRFDNAPRSEEVLDKQVKDVLDQMVRDHDLDNEAAERMSIRWMGVFKHRSQMSGDAEGKLDMDEFEAQLPWLKDSVLDAEEAKPPSAGAEEKRTAQVQSNKGNEEERSIPNDLPFSWKRPSTSGFRRAEITGRRSFSASAYQLGPKTGFENQQKISNVDPSTCTPPSPTPIPTLPHLTPTGSAHMVSVTLKPPTHRTAIAAGTVTFSTQTPLTLIRTNALKKGDVLSVSRIAGIMAAKRCPDLIPLCHPITLTHAGVELHCFDATAEDKGRGGCGGVNIEAKVECTGATGVEMEALTAVTAAALTVVDMCKAVDKGMRIQDVRVVLKEGGRSGVWREEGWVSCLGRGD